MITIKELSNTFYKNKPITSSSLRFKKLKRYDRKIVNNPELTFNFIFVTLFDPKSIFTMNYYAYWKSKQLYYEARHIDKLPLICRFKKYKSIGHIAIQQ